MKKLFAKMTIAAICAAALLFGTASAATTGQVKLGVVSVNYNSPSIQVQTDAAIAAAKKLGWKVELFNGRGDQAATNNAAINFINRGFNAILDTASTNDQMTHVIAYAKKHHVPYVSTFSGYVPGVVADIGVNNVATGTISAMQIAGRIHGHGHVVALNWTVLPALLERDIGFHAVMKGFPNIKVTEIHVKVPGQVHDTFKRLSDYLLAHKDVDAVWTGWDEIAAPAARAIQQAGRAKDIFVVSQDGTHQAVALIRKGSPLVATVAYGRKQIGEKAIEVIANALKGKYPKNPIVNLNQCLITKQTAPPKGQSINFKTCHTFSGG